MGGMVTIAARYENGETVAFKTSTNFFHYNMNSPHLLDEDKFKAKVVEYDFLRDDNLPEKDAEIYDNRKSVIAPYDYGIIFIDYYGKKLLSCNDFSAIIHANSGKVLDEYSNFLKQDFILEIQDYKGNTEQVIDIRENRFMEQQEMHFLHMAIKHNALIKLKGKNIEYDGSIESVLDNMFDINLQGKSIDEQLLEIKRYKAEEAKLNNEKYGKPYRFSLENYSDITFKYPNFELIECNNDKEHSIIYDYIQNSAIKLTSYEHSVWKEYIDKKLKSYEEQLDREEDE